VTSRWKMGHNPAHALDAAMSFSLHIGHDRRGASEARALGGSA